MAPDKWKVIRQANSKGDLIKHIQSCHKALAWYANESNWAVRGEEILWLGDDDPTYAAAVTMGLRKPDKKYKQNEVKNELGDSQKDASKDGGGNAVLVEKHPSNAGT